MEASDAKSCRGGKGEEALEAVKMMRLRDDGEEYGRERGGCFFFLSFLLDVGSCGEEEYMRERGGFVSDF